MNRCPITYQACGKRKYAPEGLLLLSRKLSSLKDFPYTAQEQVRLAAQFAAKLSIQGIQPKLSVRLNVKEKCFEIVGKEGRFILKPPNPHFEELPQNEDLTMRLASLIGIEVPLHGMIYNIDGSLTYFIQRFDRLAKNQKVGVEDFSQLLGFSRDTKYESSMEQIASVIEKYCTFPMIEKIKLFRLMIFNFLTGNEDMHLKNFTLIRRNDKVELSPAYDLVNSTIVMPTKEETALPIRGKKSKLTRKDFVDYFGQERLKIAELTLSKELLRFVDILPIWKDLIGDSFLSSGMRKRYQELIAGRWKRMFS